MIAWLPFVSEIRKTIYVPDANPSLVYSSGMLVFTIDTCVEEFAFFTEICYKCEKFIFPKYSNIFLQHRLSKTGIVSEALILFPKNDFSNVSFW